MEDLELRQILQLILDKVSSIESRLTNVESTVADMNVRLTNVESTVTDMNVRLTNVESTVTDMNVRLTNVESTVTDMNVRFTNVESDINEIKLTQENVTNKHLQILSEGHQLLAEKFDQIDKASADIEEIKGGMAVIEMTTAHNWSTISALKMAR